MYSASDILYWFEFYSNWTNIPIILMFKSALIKICRTKYENIKKKNKATWNGKKTRQESERSCICVLRGLVLPLSTILIFDIGISDSVIFLFSHFSFFHYLFKIFWNGKLTLFDVLLFFVLCICNFWIIDNSFILDSHRIQGTSLIYNLICILYMWKVKHDCVSHYF